MCIFKESLFLLVFAVDFVGRFDRINYKYLLKSEKTVQWLFSKSEEVHENKKKKRRKSQR